MENEVQAAREAQAAAQTQIAELRASQAQFEEQRESLETVVAELEGQQTELESQIAAAQTQRDEVQAQLETLTATLSERTDQLAAIEAEVATLQDGGDAAAQANISGIVPGRFVAQGAGNSSLTFLFGDDGSFAAWEGVVLDAETAEPDLSGTYAASEGELTIEEIDGGGSVPTPIACEIEAGDSGLVVGGDCVLSGLTLRQVR
jgi:exonuclease VII small subunit